MSHIRVVRLPDRFYLPRRTYSGQEIFDVVPWEGATDYVTDGTRYGVMMRDGAVRWFEESRVEQFAQDFEGIDVEALVEGLHEYTRRYRVLQTIWKDDLDALEQLRSEHQQSRDPEDEPEPAQSDSDSREGLINSET